MSYIFTCKDESHRWLAEQAAYGELNSYKRREWNGRNHLEYRYRWVNGLENRCEMETWNEEKQKTTYKNSWITDKELREENVKPNR